MFPIGNAAGEAHPAIAEGISMALQSAVLLSRRLAAWHRSGRANADLHQLAIWYRRAWQRAFGPRLLASSLVANWAMNPKAVDGVLPALRCFPTLLTWGARCDDGTSGARALMLAVLEDAMRCIQRGRRRRHRQNRQLTEAEAWVRCDSQEWLFSFASICDVCGIDADALRARLLIDVEPPDCGRVARGAPARSIRDCAV